MSTSGRFHQFKIPNWVIQTLFMLVALGLPGVLVFAWVFEMTPEGIKVEREIHRSQSVTPQTGRRLDKAIIVFLVLAVAVLLIERRLIIKSKDTHVSYCLSEGCPDLFYDLLNGGRWWVRLLETCGVSIPLQGGLSRLECSNTGRTEHDESHQDGRGIF